MFSIIIPLFNKAPYIEKAILSIAAQSYRDFELIVIDDGSTDKGLEKVRALFKSLNLPLGGWRVVTQPNQGVSFARNNGVKLAKYDYIAFLDADDWWAPDYLENMKVLIEKYPEAGIYGSSYFKVKNKKESQADIGVDITFCDGLINYFQVYAKTLWMPLWTGSTIIKKRVFEELHGFNPKLKLGEDFDLWRRVAAKYPVAFFNKPLAYYNQDVDIKTRAVGEKLYEPHEHMLFSDYDELKKTNQDFVCLFDKLVLYGLVPYYASRKNMSQIHEIMKDIRWNNHEFKYYLYYKILNPSFLKIWLDFLRTASYMKQYLKRKFI